MNKVIVGLVGVASLSFAACGGEAPDSGETGSLGQDLVLATDGTLLRAVPSDSVSVAQRVPPSSPVLSTRKPGFNPLDNVLAALATAVLKCKGSLTAKDFSIGDPNIIGDPGIVPNFQECPRDPRQLEEIKLMLGIQLYEKANAKRYFVSQWETYLKRVDGVECPTWHPAEEINPPTPENVRNYVTGAGQSKTNYRWKIEPTRQCQGEPRCSVESAATCSSWAGSQFVVKKDPIGELTTDPQWWWDNTYYYPTPFDPSYGYEHPMAQSGYKPGDIYGALNRSWEFCSKYTADGSSIMSWRQLEPIDCDGFGWYCMSMCN